MKTRLSNKIRLLLNELAILNQPEQIDGEISYEKEILLKIKSLCTELYFLTEQSIENGDFVNNEVGVGDRVKTTPDPVITAPEPESEPKFLPEASPEFDAWPTPDPVVTAPEPEPIKKVAPKPEPVPEPDLTAEELKDNTLPGSGKHNAESLNNQISITRRFEYINNLFGGNAELYLEFLAVLAESGTEDQAMEVFKKAFQENNWIRREETAQDLKKMIHKIF